MKNIFGNTNDLKLFGPSGELRYDYFSNVSHVWEIYYNELGEVDKYKETKK